LKIECCTVQRADFGALLKLDYVWNPYKAVAPPTPSRLFDAILRETMVRCPCCDGKLKGKIDQDSYEQHHDICFT